MSKEVINDQKQKIIKEIQVGNDNRQFILRIPTRISDKTILDNFKKSYVAEVEYDPSIKNQIIERFKNG